MLQHFSNGATRLPLALAVGLLAALVGAKDSVGQIVGDAVFAAKGNDYPNEGDLRPVWETSLAINQDWATAVFHVGFDTPSKKVAYSVAYYDANEAAWIWDPGTREAEVPAYGYRRTWDPAIAADPDTGAFVAVAMGFDAEPPFYNRVLISRSDPAEPEPQLQQWSWIAWRGSDCSMDKPWIVTGQSTLTGREFYVVWQDQPAPNDPMGYGYARSTNGGADWTWDVIRVNGIRVRGAFCALPATDPNDPSAPLYVAYRRGKSIRFLKGVDVGDEVEFSHVIGITGLLGPLGSIPPAPLVVPLIVEDATPYVPPNGVRALTSPHLALDPNDPNTMYVVYHDAFEAFDPEDPPEDVDIDVFIRKLSKVGGNWHASTRVRVNDDLKDPEHPRDQYTPAVTVDRLGRIHVTFYDDRDPEYADQVDSTALPKFDFYYAFCPQWGEPFDNYEISTALPNDPPALDHEHWEDGPREYTGIAYYYDETREGVLTTFTGTDRDEPPLEWNTKAVIFSNQITDLPAPLP